MNTMTYSPLTYSPLTYSPLTDATIALNERLEYLRSAQRGLVLLAVLISGALVLAVFV